VSNAALPRVRAAGFWKVDADLYRQSGWGRMTTREAFGMRDERLIEHPLAGGVEPRRLAGVHRRRREAAICLMAAMRWAGYRLRVLGPFPRSAPCRAAVLVNSRGSPLCAQRLDERTQSS